MDKDKLLTTREASQILRIHPATFYRWVRSGKIPAIKLGGITSQWKIRQEDLDRILRGK